MVMPQSFEILGQRGLFKLMADRTDLVESISAAIAFHAVAQKTDGAKVPLLKTGFNRREVSLPISEKAGHNRFQVGIDVNNNPLLLGIRLRLPHCGPALSKAASNSSSVILFNGLVM